MKSLDNFTVEQLTEFIESDHAQCGDIAALARIALAAKRAKAAATADNERLKRVIEEAQKEIDSMQETIDYVHRRRVTWKDRYLFAEKKIKEIMTVDTTPRLNSPEIPDGWISIPRDMLADYRDVKNAEVENYKVGFAGYYDQEGTRWARDFADLCEELAAIDKLLAVAPEKPL